MIMVVDHFTVFATRKKKRRKKNVKIETVRDYGKFDSKNFCNLIDSLNWEIYDMSTDPSDQWKFLFENITEILSIMCPYKRVHSRTPRKNG